MTACERIRAAREARETEVDFRVENHGSIVLLRPLTSLAEAWVEDHVGYETMVQDAIVVEHRYIVPIIEGFEAEGLSWEGA